MRRAVRLHRRRHRERDGLCLAEGPDAVRSAVRSGWAAELLITPEARDRERELLEEAQRRSVATHLLAGDAMSAACEAATPQPVAAICRYRTTGVGDLIAALAAGADGHTPALPVLVECGDPGNIGTVVRLADAVAAVGVIVTAGSADPFSPKAIRASTGSVFTVPLVVGLEPLDVVKAARTEGIQVVATVPTGGRDLFDPSVGSSLVEPTVWVLGSESRGLPLDVIAACDESVSIPMRGGAESLNVAAAAALCLFESARRTHPP